MHVIHLLSSQLLKSQVNFDLALSYSDKLFSHVCNYTLSFIDIMKNAPKTVRVKHV